MATVDVRPDDKYSITLNMSRKYRHRLRIAAILAKEMGMIEEDSIHHLMNLFVNLGLKYIKWESLKSVELDGF